jgi:hypothetical protein
MCVPVLPLNCLGQGYDGQAEAFSAEAEGTKSKRNSELQTREPRLPHFFSALPKAEATVNGCNLLIAEF